MMSIVNEKLTGNKIWAIIIEQKDESVFNEKSNNTCIDLIYFRMKNSLILVLTEAKNIPVIFGILEL